MLVCVCITEKEVKFNRGHNTTKGTHTHTHRRTRMLLHPIFKYSCMLYAAYAYMQYIIIQVYYIINMWCNIKIHCKFESFLSEPSIIWHLWFYFRIRAIRRELSIENGFNFYSHRWIVTTRPRGLAARFGDVSRKPHTSMSFRPDMRIGDWSTQNYPSGIYPSAIFGWLKKMVSVPTFREG